MELFKVLFIAQSATDKPLYYHQQEHYSIVMGLVKKGIFGYGQSYL